MLKCARFVLKCARFVVAKYFVTIAVAVLLAAPCLLQAQQPPKSVLIQAQQPPKSSDV